MDALKVILHCILHRPVCLFASRYDLHCKDIFLTKKTHLDIKTTNNVLY